MHSPVLINADPARAPDDDSTDDWLYESDDYFDDVPPLALPPSTRLSNPAADPPTVGQKRRRNARDTRPSKRRRGADVPPLTRSESAEGEQPEPSSPEPPVLWRKDRDWETRWPVLKDGEGERVALLADWRERCGVDGPRTAAVAAAPGAKMAMRAAAGVDGRRAERPRENGVAARRKRSPGVTESADDRPAEALRKRTQAPKAGGKKRKQADDETGNEDERKTHQGAQSRRATEGAESGPSEPAQEGARRSKRLRTAAV